MSGITTEVIQSNKLVFDVRIMLDTPQGKLGVTYTVDIPKYFLWKREILPEDDINHIRKTFTRTLKAHGILMLAPINDQIREAIQNEIHEKMTGIKNHKDKLLQEAKEKGFTKIK